MFVAKKHIKISITHEFESSNRKTIKIDTVEKFKLLGVMIDNKLNFNQHVNQQCISINRKLHAIKSLFYLPFQVKLQFFKTFILPYLDYCQTLCIYFKGESIKRMAKYYYMCLFKLFKWKFEFKSNEQINKELEKYGLMSFHNRLVYRLLTFTSKVKILEKPIELSASINKFKEINTRHNLRSNKQKTIFIEKTNTKYGDITFKTIIGKLLNHLSKNENHAIFALESSSLKIAKQMIGKNINKLTEETVKIIKKFNFEINFSFFH